MEKTILPIRQIKVDEKLYPRKTVDKGTVKEYVESMKRGDVFPPIDVALYKGKYYLIDGRHRLEANEERGEKYVQAEIRKNIPDFDSMFLAAIRANLNHGLRLKEVDKLKIAQQLKDMKYDVEDISRMVGLSVEKFEKTLHFKASDIIFKTKVANGELPRKLTEKVKRGSEIKEIVDNKEVKRMVDKNKDFFQISQLKEIYSYLKAEKFNLKNKRIKTLLAKIRKVIALR